MDLLTWNQRKRNWWRNLLTGMNFGDIVLQRKARGLQICHFSSNIVSFSFSSFLFVFFALAFRLSSLQHFIWFKNKTHSKYMWKATKESYKWALIICGREKGITVCSLRKKPDKLNEFGLAFSHLVDKLCIRGYSRPPILAITSGDANQMRTHEFTVDKQKRSNQHFMCSIWTECRESYGPKRSPQNNIDYHKKCPISQIFRLLTHTNKRLDQLKLYKIHLDTLPPIVVAHKTTTKPAHIKWSK